MPRPLTFEETWAREGHRITAGPPRPMVAPLDVLRDGSDEEDGAYTRRALTQYLEGGAAAPSNHIYDYIEPPCRRMASRAAGEFCTRHDKEKRALVGHARRHAGTLCKALDTCTPASAAPLGGSSSSRDAASSPRMQDTVRRPLAAAAGAAGAAQHTIVTSCACDACVQRSEDLADAMGVMSHYGHIMATQGRRLHHALAAGPDAALDLAAAGGGRSYAYAAGPKGAGGEGVGSAGSSDVEESERLPAYVMQRYSRASGVRERTLGRVAGAIASSGRRETSGGGGGGGASRAGPTPLDQLDGDPRLARMVAAMEVGEDVAGRRAPLSARVLAEVSRRVGEAAERSALREVDPDDSGEGQEEDARRALRRRSHGAVARLARSANNAAASAASSPRQRAMASAMATSPRRRVSVSAGGAGGGMPAARHVQIKLEAELDAAAATGAPASAHSRSSFRRSRASQSAGGAAEGAHRAGQAPAAFSDSSEDDYARRVANSSSNSRRRRTAEAISRTLHGLAEAVAAAGARPSSAAGSSQQQYLTHLMTPRSRSQSEAASWDAGTPTATAPGSNDEPLPSASGRVLLADAWAHHTPQGRRLLGAAASQLRQQQQDEDDWQEEEAERRAAAAAAWHRRLKLDDAPASASASRPGSWGGSGALSAPDSARSSSSTPAGAHAQAQAQADRLTASERRLLAAAGLASPGAAAPYTHGSWTPVGRGGSSGGLDGGIGIGAMDMMSSRLSAPDDFSPLRHDHPGAAGAALPLRHKGGPPRQQTGGSWAERVYRSVSRPGTPF